MRIEPQHTGNARRRVLRGAAAGILLGVTGCMLPPRARRSEARRVVTSRHGELELHAVQFAQRSTRLTYMGLDDEGGLWAGSGERVLNRYDPRTGELSSWTQNPGGQVSPPSRDDWILQTR